MKKNYKKIMFAFVGALVLCVFNLTGQNLLINPSFETGIIAPWTAGNGNEVTIIEDAQDGMWAANGNIEQIVSLQAGVKYTWTTQVKCLGGCDINMWIGIKDLVADALVTNFRFSDFNEYGEATIEFESASTGDHRFWVWGLDGTDYASDNHVLLAEGTTSIFDTKVEDERIKITNNQYGVNINIEDAIKDAIVSLHDLSGRTIYSKEIARGDTFLNNNLFPANGIYVVSVQTATSQNVSKIAVHK